MANSDTPGSGSPLSDMNSDDFPEDMKFNRFRSHSNASTGSGGDDSDASATPSTSTPRLHDMPPTKRRRTGASTYDHATPQPSSMMPPRSPTGSISSDTSGSVPTSPSYAHLGPTHPLSTYHAAAQANPDNPEMADYVQVTRCQWTDCQSPEQGNMDNLVNHLNEVHIPPRQKKYFCEWEGCNRKSMPHTSAYALKAHMRSHTKEKPFLCALPECDRSFTRSDALAKHMRTVHETEALRPSDPVPRGHTGGISTGAHGTNGTIKRIKLVMGGANGEKRASVLNELPPLPTRSSVAASSDPHIDRIISTTSTDELALKLSTSEATDPDLIDAIDIDGLPFILPVATEYYPTDVYESMDDFEKALPPSQYYRLLRRQVHWAQQEQTRLIRELADARGTTDDVEGNEIKRDVPIHGSAKDHAGSLVVDERVGDEIRQSEWSVAEALLDHMLAVDVMQAATDLHITQLAMDHAPDTVGKVEEGEEDTKMTLEVPVDQALQENGAWNVLKKLAGLRPETSTLVLTHSDP